MVYINTYCTTFTAGVKYGTEENEGGRDGGNKTKERAVGKRRTDDRVEQRGDGHGRMGGE